MADKDRRSYVRLLHTSRTVDFSVEGDRVYLGFIENKCEGGVFIKTGGRFSEGQDISMTFETPKIGIEKRTGKIVRVTPDGIGVKFTEERGCVRRPTTRNVEFSVEEGDHVYLGLIEDKSDSGVFIETGGRFPEGQDISMTIESPKFGSRKRTGKIVRVTPLGIGVKFNYPGYTR